MSSTRDIERDERNGRSRSFRSQRRDEEDEEDQEDEEDEDQIQGSSSDGQGWGFWGLLGGAAIGAIAGGIVATHHLKNKPEQKLADQLSQSFEASREGRERRRKVRDGDLRDDQICVVCMTNAREIVLLPCGHVCICEDCSVSIKNNCPICRKRILGRTTVYMS